jgi:hypothetical protein
MWVVVVRYMTISKLKCAISGSDTFVCDPDEDGQKLVWSNWCS